MNDTVGKNRFVPSQLVFGKVPLPVFVTDSPTRKERLEAISKALVENNAINAECMLCTALIEKLSKYADQIFLVEDRFCIFLEPQQIKRSFHWYLCKWRNGCCQNSR